LERKKESGRRLQEQAAKMRAEKLAQNENDLEYYRRVMVYQDQESKRDFQRRVEGEGFADITEMEKEIKRLEAAIKRSKQRDLERGGGSQVDEEDATPPTFPLLDIPDDQLDAEQLKQKRQQRLNKAGYEARMRAKAEKEAERQKQEERQAADDELRSNNFDAWLEGKRQSRHDLLDRLKVQRRLKAELNDRKSLASQMRMKSIANLASDTPNGKKRRKGDDDTFGANDADWNIYKDISTSKEGAEVESEDDEERTLEALRKIEGLLLLHDAAFDESQSIDAAKDVSKSLIHAFLRGSSGPFDHNDPAQMHQIHLNVERIRVPEVLFSPGIAGVDQAGLIEIASGIMQRSGYQDQLIKDIFVTGGFGALEGLDTRIARELRAVLPFGSDLRVRKAGDVKLDAWRGAAKWCLGMNPAGKSKNFLTKKAWEECGGDYLIEHEMGNIPY
jgi:actin-related protein 5